MTDKVLHLLGQIALFAFCGATIGWVMFLVLKRSEDPVRLIVKWVVTALIIWFMVSFGSIFLALFCGLVLTIIWRHSIGSVIASPFASIYDGGSTPPDPHPAYSVA